MAAEEKIPFEPCCPNCPQGEEWHAERVRGRGHRGLRFISDSSRQADPVRSDRSGLSLVRQSDDTTTTPSEVQRQADV
jgi:hypothetical protein